jgi:putative Mg2+ transporter-C (MgtC) family protein
MDTIIQDVFRILLSILIGGLIGAEREFRDKTAGFRTIIFICVGATLFTILSEKLGGETGTYRIAANIVSGIGFLGAGVILRAGGRVVGLTTASTIWLTAAIGMGIGSGQYYITGAITFLIMIILWLFPRFEEWIDRAQETRTYEIKCNLEFQKSFELKKLFEDHDLHVKSFKQFKTENELFCSLLVYGSPGNHDQVREKLFADEQVKAFNY